MKTFFKKIFNWIKNILFNKKIKYTDEFNIYDKAEKSEIYEDEKDAVDEAMPHFNLENCSYGDLIKPYKGYEAELCENGYVKIKKK